MEIREPFYPGVTYHIASQPNGNELLFCDHTDYLAFFFKYKYYMHYHWDTIAWILLPDQFHLLIRIKTPLSDFQFCTSHQQSRIFGHFLNSYVQYYNAKYDRQGSLLNRSFRRKSISSEQELHSTVCRIHQQPVARGLSHCLSNWPYSSYPICLSYGPLPEFTQKMVDQFGTREDFRLAHETNLVLEENILPKRTWSRLHRAQRLYPLGQNPIEPSLVFPPPYTSLINKAAG